MEKKMASTRQDSDDNQTEKDSSATGGANDGHISCGSCKLDFVAIKISQGDKL